MELHTLLYVQLPDVLRPGGHIMFIFEKMEYRSEYGGIKEMVDFYS